MKQTIEVLRSGQFTANMKPNDRKCGLNADLPNTHVFPYEVRIVVWANDLDEHGFVIDNRDVEKYFKETYTTRRKLDYISCEEMAQRALEHFRHALGARFVIKCEVMIQGFPGAQVIARFEHYNSR